jgi:hypothetical protein
MSEDQRELFFDLLTKKAVYGLGQAEELQLRELDDGTADTEFLTLEMTAAAITLAELPVRDEEPLPSHLRERIADAADAYVRPPQPITVNSTSESRGSTWFGWLGWAAAAAACIALAVNIYINRTEPAQQAQQPQVDVPRVLTPDEKRAEMLRAASGEIVKATWAPGNVKDVTEIAGDVVWSDTRQEGYLHFKGLPPNNPHKETYQLWIFDKTQDKATPIDGGTFDVPPGGEVVVPINPRLRPSEPEMFAVTIEKPGGVVVSKRERIVALAKVEPGKS